MFTLKAALKKRLNNATRIALIGVGSEFRGDDIAGLLVVRQLKEQCRKIRPQRKLKFKAFIGSTAPENLSAEIKRFKPSHVIIVDAADMAKRPGAAQLIRPEESGGFSFCTHKLPLGILADYLIQSLGCEIIIIGIQPKALDFGSRFSKQVEKSAGAISRIVREIIF